MKKGDVKEKRRARSLPVVFVHDLNGKCYEQAVNKLPITVAELARSLDEKVRFTFTRSMHRAEVVPANTRKRTVSDACEHFHIGSNDSIRFFWRR